MNFSTVLIIGATLALASGVPTRPFAPKPGNNPFTNVTAPACSTTDNVIRVQNGMIDPTYRWTHFLVHPDAAYNDEEREAISDAMYTLKQVIPCITFGIWPPEAPAPAGDYVRIIKGTDNGCSSFVGRQGGRQDMNLESPNCMSNGTIVHQMIHALGFHHEHNRPDRSDYILVLWGNILPEHEFRFDKLEEFEVTTFNISYNYNSIMHYRATDYAKDERFPTMLGENGQYVGTEGILQDTDIAKLKAMYDC